jgi:16S rRNA (uracil1498-N3)-methyltransferase
MKQSIKAFNPVIDELLPFQDCLKIVADYKLIAHVDNSNPTLLKDQIQKSGSHLVLVGPEGDFSDKEIALAMTGGFSKVSLGESRLRTETAGIATAHLLNL